ncbi:uncharacterized protein LOC143265908 isoform X2 [Megachile rotundata]|uniref:uncharacterized protein LOC143265908 isoform X2 n=1 Tax=Megachile rotundata TaxID=143995 RepID=UPI003FD09509
MSVTPQFATPMDRVFPPTEENTHLKEAEKTAERRQDEEEEEEIETREKPNGEKDKEKDEENIEESVGREGVPCHRVYLTPDQRKRAEDAFKCLEEF